MLKIGLTGGIGSGKSTVARLFATHGALIVDADQVAHALVAPGQPALQRLRDEFGGLVFNDDGALNRAALRELVFAEPQARKRLEAILHPMIQAEMLRSVATLNGNYAILSLPLLLEAHWEHIVDRIAVVDCPEPLQTERVKSRDGIPESTVWAIMQAQASRAQRLAAADDIIDNGGTTAQLAQQVERLHNLYLTLRIAQGTPNR